MIASSRNILARLTRGFSNSFKFKFLDLIKTHGVLMILSSFCDLVHAESVVDLFAKQLNNARERAQNHK